MNQKTLQGFGPEQDNEYIDMQVAVQVKRNNATIEVRMPYDTFARDFRRVHLLVRGPQALG